MTFYTLLPPCAPRFNINKTMYEIRIENKGDLPSEKSISRNALLVMILAIFRGLGPGGAGGARAPPRIEDL